MWMPTFAVRKLGWRRIRPNEQGLTLIELMVAITIIAVMFMVAASGLRQLFDVNLKKSASEMAAMLRYLSAKAVTENLYLRVVYDLDNKEYWVEESHERFLIVKENPKEKVSKKDQAAKKDEDKDKDKESSKESDGTEEEKPAFNVSQSVLLKKRHLPGEVRFKDVYADYLGHKEETGQVHTYFFPDGNSTGTIVHLQEGENEEDVFSVELTPVSGRVRISREYVEPEHP